MRIRTVSVPVLDQQRAHDFYTKILGFETKHDIPLGGGNRWLTLVSPHEKDGPEVLLEPAPLHFAPSKVYQEALFEAGIPWTQFEVDDVDAEYKRLSELDVSFKMEPTEMGPSKVAILNDTCGNYIQLVQLLN